jgi:hypothetical protein
MRVPIKYNHSFKMHQTPQFTNFEIVYFKQDQAIVCQRVNHSFKMHQIPQFTIFEIVYFKQDQAIVCQRVASFGHKIVLSADNIIDPTFSWS